MKLAPSSPRGKMLLELGIIYLSLQAALPAALAVFPQRTEFDVHKLEPQFRGLSDRFGKPITKVYANKGL